MKIELNPYFKPNESVLYCGNAVYATLQSRREPFAVKGYVRIWKVRALRRGTNTHYYAQMKNGTAKLVKGALFATAFPSYSEADEIAKLLMGTGNMLETEIIEILKFEYEDDSYAT